MNRATFSHKLVRAMIAFLAVFAVATAVFYFWNRPLVAELVVARTLAAPVDIPADVDAHFSAARPGSQTDVWVLEAERPRPIGSVDWVLILHGISDHKGPMLGLAQRFSKRGTGAILIDMRGHGSSSALPLTYGVEEARDISAVLNAMEEHGYNVQDVGIYGPSYGGAIAIQASARDARITRVVTVACFADATRILQHRFSEGWGFAEPLVPTLWTKLMALEAGSQGGFHVADASPVRAVTQGNARMLLVHSKGDETVYFEHAEALQAACGDRCEHLWLEGMSHLQSLSNEPLRQALHRFMTGERLVPLQELPPVGN